MSYIRSGSNPEGLYIVSGSMGVEIFVHPSPLTNVKGTPSVIILPPYVFHTLARKWNDWPGDDATGRRFRGGLVREDHIYLDTGRRVPDQLSMKKILASKRPSKFMIRLEYRGQYVYMHEVTWAYLVHGIMENR